MKPGFLRIAVLLCAFGATLVRAQPPETPLRLGVYPFAEATKVVARFSPLARYLEERVGRKVEIQVAAGLSGHIEKTGHDAYDLSYLGPTLYSRVVEKYGPKPILARFETNGASTFRGAIFVRNDSTISKLTQLRGKSFAFGDRESTMGFVVPHYLLRRAGVGLMDLGGYIFLSNQEDVALSVLAGHFDAGAARQQTFEDYESRGLRALAWSDPMPDRLFVSSAKLDPETRKALTRALLALAGAEGGAQILQALQMGTTAFVPGSDDDYRGYRKILVELDKPDDGGGIR